MHGGIAQATRDVEMRIQRMASAGPGTTQADEVAAVAAVEKLLGLIETRADLLELVKTYAWTRICDLERFSGGASQRIGAAVNAARLRTMP